MKKNNYILLDSSNKTISLISYLTANNIEMLNAKKIDTGFQFELNENNYNSFKKLDVSRFNISILSLGGKKRFFGQVLYRSGLIVGLIVCCIMMLIFQNRLFQIHIRGLSTISESEVKNELKVLGIGMFTPMNFDLSNLENYLSEKFNFSLVSIITKGNSLIISVKESLPDLEDSYVPITSDYNMVINSITTYSGTQKVSVGDIVYKGDVIVEPYVEKNGDRVYVSPCADITATIFFSKSYKFLKSEEIFKRTGEKCLISSNVSLGRWNIIHSEKDNPFINYEIEETSNTISQYFLPISINKIYAYELTLVTIEHDFDLEKDGIINDLKNSVYSQLGNYEVSNENAIITKIDGGYIINYNVESVIQLKYQYYN